MAENKTRQYIKVKNRKRKKGTKKLIFEETKETIAIWTKKELEELGYNLRTYIENKQLL